MAYSTSDMRALLHRRAAKSGKKYPQKYHRNPSGSERNLARFLGEDIKHTARIVRVRLGAYEIRGIVRVATAVVRRDLGIDGFRGVRSPFHRFRIVSRRACGFTRDLPRTPGLFSISACGKDGVMLAVTGELHAGMPLRPRQRRRFVPQITQSSRQRSSQAGNRARLPLTNAATSPSSGLLLLLELRNGERVPNNHALHIPMNACCSTRQC